MAHLCNVHPLLHCFTIYRACRFKSCLGGLGGLVGRRHTIVCAEARRAISADARRTSARTLKRKAAWGHGSTADQQQVQVNAEQLPAHKHAHITELSAAKDAHAHAQPPRYGVACQHHGPGDHHLFPDCPFHLNTRVYVSLLAATDAVYHSCVPGSGPCAGQPGRPIACAEPLTATKPSCSFPGRRSASP